MDTSSNWDSSTDAMSSSLQHSGSSSTLRSYDDLLRIRLSLPQQTSSSSARDLTLHEGYSPTLSPLDLDKFGEYTKTTTQSRDRLDRKDYTHLGRSSPHLDQSVLSSNSYSSNGLLSSPHGGMESPFSLSTPTDSHQSTPSSGRKWFGLKIKKRKVFRSGAFETARLDSDVIDQLQLSSIIAVRRPKDKVQNWFDGLEEEECVVPDQRNDSSDYRLHQAPNPSNVVRFTAAPVLGDIDKEDYYLMNRNRHNSTCARISSFEQDSISMQIERFSTHHGLQASEVRSTRSNSTQQSLDPRQNCESIFLKNNLHKQSVLALSLSEDDSENEEERTAGAPRGRIRESVDEPASSDVSLHSAQQVAYSRSGPIATKKARIISTPDPRTTARDGNCLSVLDQPLARSKSSVSKYHRGSNQGATHLDLEHNTTSGDNHSSSPQSLWPILQSRDDDRLLSTGQSRRMIAVTEDEAHLLEAMRLKGTSAKSKAPNSYSIFPPGKSENGVILGRNAADPDPHPSFHRADMSNFPSPPSLASTKIYTRSFRANPTNSVSLNRVVASSSSLETFICLTDHVAKPRLSPNIQFDPPLPSPSISMASIL